MYKDDTMTFWLERLMTAGHECRIVFISRQNMVVQHPDKTYEYEHHPQWCDWNEAYTRPVEAKDIEYLLRGLNSHPNCRHLIPQELSA